MPHISAKVDDTIKQAITLRRTRDGGRKVMSESDVVRELLGAALQGGGVQQAPPGMVAVFIPQADADALIAGYPALGDKSKLPAQVARAVRGQIDGITSPYPLEAIEEWREAIEAGEGLDNASARCLFEFHDNIARMPPPSPKNAAGFTAAEQAQIDADTAQAQAEAKGAQVVPFRGAVSR